MACQLQRNYESKITYKILNISLPIIRFFSDNYINFSKIIYQF